MTARLADIHDDLVLEQIRDAYSTAYDIGIADGLYRAHRLTGGPMLSAATPGGMARVIWADWTRGDIR